MSGSVQAMLFLLNRPEPIRQASLLMVLASGLGDSATLISSLTGLASENARPWSTRVAQLRILLEQGQTLSDALSNAGNLLPAQTVIAIRVAEEAGTLPQVLADEAQRLMQRSADSSSPMGSISVTVLWLMGILLITLAGMIFQMTFIVPRMLRIYQDFQVSLPRETLRLVSLSDAFAQYWFFFTLPVVTLIFAALWRTTRSATRYLSAGHVPGSMLWPRYWTPLVLRLLSVSVTARQSLEHGLHCMLKEMPPGRAQQRLSAVRLRTAAGYDCWESMRINGFLGQREVAFLEASTRSDHIDWALIHLARTIELRRSRAVRYLVNLLQPLTILGVGAMVAYISIALFAPLVKLIYDFS